MAKIVLSTFGSLGDIHPKIALGLELRKRGHEVKFNVMEAFREKFELLGFEISPLRPNLDPEDRDLVRRLMDIKTGPELMFNEILLPNLRPMYEDMMKAVEDADLIISGEVVLPIKSVVEKTGIKWVSTSLAPISFLSTDDPSVYPNAEVLEKLRFMPKLFHKMILGIAKSVFHKWFKPYREFRRELGLSENHDPMFGDKYSKLLHLAMFSKALAQPQPDWAKSTVQTGFCFYDGNQDLGNMSEDLDKFLDAGEPPIVFTLGSAAVMDARDFYEQSISAAKILNKRAVMLYGTFNQPPKGLDEQRVGFDYAPYSQLFPRACAIVHQGGIGTTSQVLRAGVPMIVMPYSHDQPDNAARCRRLGVSETIRRDNYKAKVVAEKLRKILSDESYKTNALKVKQIIDSENGTQTACDEIEKLLK
ncbi:MAG: glycosyltransferase [Pyrinomonadaceae bacterium]|nr:glycosyltransferase [Pyrinomonadaceae bacterium]